MRPAAENNEKQGLEVSVPPLLFFFSFRAPNMHRKHLFLDLQPWVCLDLACASQQTLFTSSEEWAQHLGQQHGFAPKWQGFHCPLCAAPIADGKASILRHIATHLEEISLSSLPAVAESDLGVESDLGAESEDYHDMAWQCGLCGTKFSHQRDLARHQETVHGSTPLALSTSGDASHNLALAAESARTSSPPPQTKPERPRSAAFQNPLPGLQDASETPAKLQDPSVMTSKETENEVAAKAHETERLPIFRTPVMGRRVVS